jgi:hypothetical protein
MSEGVNFRKSSLPKNIETEEQLRTELRLSSGRKRSRVHRQFKTWKKQNPMTENLTENELKEVQKIFSDQWTTAFTEERRHVLRLWIGNYCSVTWLKYQAKLKEEDYL